MSKSTGRSLFILLWLFLIIIPMFAFFLAVRQEVKIGGDAYYLRLFVLQEKDAEGIGLELAQPFASHPTCTQTEVSYFMWVGEPQNATFCHCLDPQTGYALPVTAGACTPP